MRIGLETGLRVSDILEQNKADICRGEWRTIEQKTGKVKECILTPKTLETAQDYFKTHRSTQHKAFYNSTTKKPYTRQSVYKAIKKAAKMAHIKNAGAHSTRSTYAQDLKRKGLSIEEIQKKLNHSNKKTTEIYLKNKRVKREK